MALFYTRTEEAQCRRLVPLVAIILLLGSSWTNAAIVDTKSGSVLDVTAAVAAAADGDTVRLPAGTSTWTSGLTITKAITLQGAGIGITIIKDKVPADGGLLAFNLAANKASRMTGIEFQDGGRPSQAYNGIVYVVGANTDSRTMRIDHCKFDHLNGVNINPQDVIGVIDHCTFLSSPTRIPIYVYHKNWNGQGLSAGSWSDSSHFGTDRFLFIEDNTFTFDPGTNYAAVDCLGGARWVFRYNTCTNCGLEIHGTESSGRSRGGRAQEIYNNTFVGDGTSGGQLVNVRSGVTLIHDNTASGGIYPKSFHITTHRMFWNFAPWGCADGTNSWDVNVPGGPFYSGKATGGGTNASYFSFPTMTVAGNPWTTDQWKGYSIKKTSGAPSNGSEIETNSGNTITFLTAGGYGPDLSFVSGDTFQIYKVNQAMDQPGRSGGSLVSGDPPSLPSAWNDQVTDPCYEWNNTVVGGSNAHFSPGVVLIRANEHYFNETQAPGYAPYTYPHPLTSGSAQPNPPANLRLGP
jgi:hypothetical protein